MIAHKPSRSADRLRARFRSFLAILFVIAAAVLAPALPRPQQPATASGGNLSLIFDPAKSRIHWTLETTLHTVHGTFKLTRGSLHFNPDSGAVTGEIVADAMSGESGNSGRDSKMHKDVLESAKYSEVIFRPDRVSGKFSGSGDSSLDVHGIFVLHGSEHELTIPVQISSAGAQWTSTSKFKVPFLSWGLKNPSNFLLKVKPEVEIELDGAGALSPDSVPK